MAIDRASKRNCCEEDENTLSNYCAECGRRKQPREQQRASRSSISSSSSRSSSNNNNSINGAEAAILYDTILDRIRTLSSSKERIRQFKKVCKSYGDHQCSAEAFDRDLRTILGSAMSDDIYPDLIRLMPNPEKQQQLINLREKKNQPKLASKSSSPSSSSSSTKTKTPVPTERSSSSSNRSTSRKSSTSLLKGPHNWGSEGKEKGKACEFCDLDFNWIRRRHQCRVCAGYFCDKHMKFLIIPEGDECKEAKKFDGNAVTPQRVCDHCAPDLEPLQDQLVAHRSNQHATNSGNFSRIPFGNPTMEMEIAAAARSIQRFFKTGIFYTGALKDQYIPVKLLKDAKAIALFTNYKFGFLISGAGGTGLAMTKLPDGSWSAPIALAVHSLAFGLKAGIEFAYYMLVIRSEKGAKSLASGSLGLDASADIALGPFGRAVTATAGGGKGGMSTNLMYAHCRGLYLGVALGGQCLRVRKDVNRAFYGRDVDPLVLLSPDFPRPNACKPLYDAIEKTFVQASELEKQKEAEDAMKEEIKVKKKEMKEKQRQTLSGTPDVSPRNETPAKATTRSSQSKKKNTKNQGSKKSSSKPTTSTKSKAKNELIIQRIHDVTKSDQAVKQFKHNCKRFGTSEMTAEEFYSDLYFAVGPETCAEVIPLITEILPDKKKRKALIDLLHGRDMGR